jgi:two-component system response regulator AtoC
MHKEIAGVSEAVLKFLLNYSFKGNIRQLENIIEHAVIMCKNEKIELEHLPPEIFETSSMPNNFAPSQVPLEESEYRTILAVLDKFHWNTLKTAEELKIHRSTLWRKMKKFGLLAK